MATHLVQKPGESTWYVRMAVPVDVRRAFGGRTKLIKTTGTSNKAEAMDKRLPILAQWKADIRTARDAKGGSGDEWRLAQHTVGKDLQQRRINAVTQIYTPPNSASAPSDTSWFETLPEIVNSLRSDGQNEIADRLTNLARKYIGVIENGVSSGEGVDLHNEFLTIIGELEAACIADEYDLSVDEHQEALEIVRNPSTYKPLSPITETRLAAFRTYREKSEIAPKTIDQQESKLSKLSDYLRDQGAPLIRVTIAAWLETLGLTSKTKAQYLLAGSTFWRWAIKHDAHWREDYAEKDNPFTGQELPKIRVKAKADATRKAFTCEEIESIYATAKQSKNEIMCDLIALGSHTGCRIEELAQLRTDSIITVEGIRSFKITDSKTVAGIREIPIHPSLVAIVDRLISKSSDGFLLKSSAGNKYGIRSDSLSKAFGRLKTAQGFGKKHVFHSVRAMVVTLLLRKGTPGSTVANIVGHETGVVTYDVYDQGASPKQKLDALTALEFHFD